MGRLSLLVAAAAALQVFGGCVSAQDSFPFSITDSVYMTYTTAGQRDVFLQQVLVIWRNALNQYGSTNVAISFVSERRAGTSGPTSTGTSRMEVSYKVTGSSSQRVDINQARSEFRSVLKESGLSGVEATGSSSDFSQNSGSNDNSRSSQGQSQGNSGSGSNSGSNTNSMAKSFTITDTVVLTYTTTSQRTTFLNQILQMWRNVLNTYQATNLKITFVSESQASGFNSASTKSVTYRVTGSSVGAINQQQAKQQLHQSIVDAHLSGVQIQEGTGSSTQTDSSDSNDNSQDNNQSGSNDNDSSMNQGSNQGSSSSQNKGKGTSNINFGQSSGQLNSISNNNQNQNNMQQSNDNGDSSNSNSGSSNSNQQSGSGSGSQQTTDTVMMNYQTTQQRDDFLQQILKFWKTSLRGATNVQITFVSVRTVGNQKEVTYKITWSGSQTVDINSAKTNVHQSIGKISGLSASSSWSSQSSSTNQQNSNSNSNSQSQSNSGSDNSDNDSDNTNSNSQSNGQSGSQSGNQNMQGKSNINQQNTNSNTNSNKNMNMNNQQSNSDSTDNSDDSSSDNSQNANSGSSSSNQQSGSGSGSQQTTDSVMMTYSTTQQRNDLLQQILKLWKTSLRGATNVQIVFVSSRTVGNQKEVTYKITWTAGQNIQINSVKTNVHQSITTIPGLTASSSWSSQSSSTNQQNTNTNKQTSSFNAGDSNNGAAGDNSQSNTNFNNQNTGTTGQSSKTETHSAEWTNQQASTFNSRNGQVGTNTNTNSNTNKNNMNNMNNMNKNQNTNTNSGDATLNSNSNSNSDSSDNSEDSSATSNNSQNGQSSNLQGGNDANTYTDSYYVSEGATIDKEQRKNYIRSLWAMLLGVDVNQITVQTNDDGTSDMQNGQTAVQYTVTLNKNAKSKGSFSNLKSSYYSYLPQSMMQGHCTCVA